MIFNVYYTKLGPNILIVEARLVQNLPKLVEVGPSWLQIGCRFAQVRPKLAQVADKLALNVDFRRFRGSK